MWRNLPHQQLNCVKSASCVKSVSCVESAMLGQKRLVVSREPSCVENTMLSQKRQILSKDTVCQSIHHPQFLSDTTEELKPVSLGVQKLQFVANNVVVPKTRQLFQKTMKQLTRDNIITKWMCFIYCTTVIFVSISINTNQFVLKDGTKRKTFRTNHHYLLALLMALSMILCTYQLIYMYSQKRREKYPTAPKTRLIVPHVLVLLIVLSITSTLFYAWILLTMGLEKQCYVDGEYELDKSNQLLEIIYNCLVIAFFTIQAVWLVMTSYCRFSIVNTGLRFVLAICQTFVTNVALYFDITLYEAKYAFDEHKSTKQYPCASNTTSNGIKSFFTIHKNYVEPIGYATSVECIILFLIIIVTVCYEAFGESHGEHHFQTKTATDNFSTGSEPQGFHEPIPTIDIRLDDDNVSAPVAATQVSHHRRMLLYSWIFTSHLSAAILSMAMLMAMMQYAALFILYTVDKSDALEIPSYRRILALRSMCFMIMSGLLLVALVQQRSGREHNKLETSSHTMLDVRLLYIGVIAPTIYTIFVLQSVIWIGIKTDDAELNGWHIVDCVSNLCQVYLQVLFLQRALMYDTSVSIRNNINKVTNNSRNYRIDWLVELLCIILLTIFNGEMWFFNLFSRKNGDKSDPTAHMYYPGLFWSFLTEMTYPVMIFFRFHCLVIGLHLLCQHRSGLMSAKQEGLRPKSIIIPPQLSQNKVPAEQDVEGWKECTKL